MNPIPYPATWSSMGFTAKASWLHDSHYAKSYPAACAMLKHGGKPRRQVIATPRLSPQEFAAEQERRHLD